jgi:hypothetical protein
MMQTPFLIFMLCLFISTPVWAKPVTWPGGTQIMIMHDSDMNAAHAMYTITPNFSMQNRADYMDDGDIWITGIQGNYLIKRWNFPHAQANIYGSLGAGYAATPDQGDMAGFTSILADYETRRILVSYEGDGVAAGDTLNQFWHKTRIGVAPYVGEYDDVHTWIMLQTDYRPNMDDEFSATPMIRLFQTNWMIEGGISTKGRAMINTILQF